MQRHLKQAREREGAKDRKQDQVLVQPQNKAHVDPSPCNAKKLTN